jgi:SAM-dependent methyltransferase
MSNMTHEAWFDALRMVRQREHYSWLANLPGSVERIANFGCWSGCEPFALIWTLDPHEITVVEIDEKFLEGLREKQEILNLQHPQSIRDREIDYLCRDMTIPIPELPDRHFDLAYCEDVLYALPIQGGSAAVDRGIIQMIRVVKPKGFVVAVEPKFGADFATRRSKVLGIPISLPIPRSDPEDISDLFSSKGLVKLEIPSCPPYTYCYQYSFQ